MPEQPEQPTTGTVEDRELVRQALMALPVRQREVLLLRYYGDLSEAEIAARLGCAPGTVKSSAARALKALRDLLPEDVYGRHAVPGTSCGAEGSLGAHEDDRRGLRLVPGGATGHPDDSRAPTKEPAVPVAGASTSLSEPPGVALVAGGRLRSA